MLNESLKTTIKDYIFKPEFVNQIYYNYMLSVIRPDLSDKIITDMDFNTYDFCTYKEGMGLSFSEHMVYKTLNRMEFYSPIPMDSNRIEDAKFMRERFYSIYCNKMVPILLGEVPNYPIPLMDEVKLNGPPSVLEVLVAFAIRIEDDILHDDTKGYRAHCWFKIMMDNLGLSEYFGNSKFIPEQESKVQMIVDIFRDRAYSPSGVDGALFPNDRFSDKINDCRDVDLWYQMSIWFSMHPEVI